MDAQTAQVYYDKLQDAAKELEKLQEYATSLSGTYDVADYTDATSWSNEWGAQTTVRGFRWNYGLAYARCMTQPCATAAAYQDWNQWKLIVADSRAIAIGNPFCEAIKRNRITYGIGTGHVYSVLDKDGNKPDKALVRKVMGEIDDFYQVNQYRKRQGEKLHRLDRDGEFVLRKFKHRDGILRVRFVEPLTIQNPAGMGPEGGMWFGFQFDNNDYENEMGCYIRPVDYLGGDLTLQQKRDWSKMVPVEQYQHRKANVDMGSPRGLPLYYILMTRLTQAVSTLNSMGRLVDIRARIALIIQHVNAASATLSPLIARRTAGTVTGAGGLTRNVYEFRPGSIIDTNDTSNWMMPSQHIDTDKIVHSLKADLQAVAASIGFADFMLSADSAGGNGFAAAMLKEGPLDKSVRETQQDLIDDDLEILQAHLEYAVEQGRLSEDDLESIKIVGSGPDAIDRNRIQNAQADQILWNCGALSTPSMSERHGLDYERQKSEGAEAMVDSGDTNPAQAKRQGKTTSRAISPQDEPGPKVNPRRENLEEAYNTPPTSEDHAMASLWITPEWLESTKAQILGLPRTERPLEPAAISSEYEPGVKGFYLGLVDGQKVYAVDMRAVQVKHDAPELLVAGNSVLYDFVPSDTIFVTWDFTASDRAPELLLECVEQVLMRDGKWAHARAHRMGRYCATAWLLDLRPELKALKAA